MRTIRGLWRWRRNPLRRATDLAEAWLALTALLLIAVVAPLTGTVIGSMAQKSLQRTVRAQQQSRQLVTATVVRKLKDATLEIDPDTTGQSIRSRVLATWTAADGTLHHGQVLADLRSPRPGDQFTLWTDRQGRTTTRPLDSATATTHAVLAGAGAGLLTAGLVDALRRLIVWRMVRRRYARWDQDWERAGPDWGKAGTGS